MKLLYPLVLFLFAFPHLHAQIYDPMDEDFHHWVDRAEIKTNNLDSQRLHSSVKPYSCVEVLELLREAPKTRIDSANYTWFSDQAYFYSGTGKNDKPVLKYFYKHKASLFDIDIDYLKLSINPSFSFFGGIEKYSRAGNDSSHSLYINSRGIEIQGILDDKISFYTLLTDNQVRLPLQERLFGEHYYALPGESYFKKFKVTGNDFFHAEAYIAAPITRHISFQFGNSSQFIGNGIRSLILSDFSKPHLFLKINTKVWKFNYENLFYELTDSPFITGGSLYNKKFGATHHLSLNISSQFNIGVYESVIFRRKNNAYEITYLNPLIFYRAVEHSLGSPDNILLGLDFKWNLRNKFQFYGQLVLDEFELSKMRDQILKPKTDPSWGWWANKFGVQLGLKYIDIANIKNLDLQFEYNQIRPYTYSYYDPDLSYSDFNQSLAHPLGANLREYISTLIYQPVPGLTISAKAFLIQKGLDYDSVSYGGDMLQPNRHRKGFYGNALLQGLRADIGYAEFLASYRIAQGLFFEVSYTLRKQQTADISFNNKNQYILVGIRYNSKRRNFEF